jgi:outer membrane protein OmpA-like peptidoglycan-associated protein
MVSNTISAPNNMTATRVDTAFQRKDAEIDFLIRRVAESEMRLQQLEQKRIADSIAIRNAPAKPAGINNIRPTPTQQRAAQPGSTTIIQQRPVTQPSGSVRIVERQVAAPNSPAVIVQPPVNYNQEQLNRMYNRNDDLEQQIKMLRAEMAASANAASRAPGARVDTVRRVITDTAIIMDTVVIRDTVRVGVAPKPTPSSSKGEVNTVQNLIYDPVYFATGSNALSPAALRVLERVAGDYNKRPYNNKVQLTGRTDSMGSPEVNRQLAQRRIASVRNYLQENGFPNQQIISETQPDVSATPRPNAEKRRVDIEIR